MRRPFILNVNKLQIDGPPYEQDPTNIWVQALIGIRAVLLPGAVIGEGSIIAAGALVPQRRIIPPRSVVVGTPATVVRQVTDEEYESLIDSAARYVEYARSHLRVGD